MTAHKLPLRKIIWGAFALPWQHRTDAARAIGVPLLAVIGATLAGDVANFGTDSAMRWGLYGVYLLAFSWLAITVHRLVLLDAPDTGPRSNLRALRRIAFFLGALIGVWLLFAALLLLFLNLVMLVFNSSYVPAGAERAPLAVPLNWVQNVANAVALLVSARFSLIFPAIAIDRKPDLIAAWRASAGNGWRLAIVVGVLPWSLRGLVDVLYRDEATMVEVGLLVVIASIFIVIEVVALSLSFAELTEPAPPPTHPPA